MSNKERAERRKLKNDQLAPARLSVFIVQTLHTYGVRNKTTTGSCHEASYYYYQS